MSKNIVEELPARKHAPVAAAPSKGGDAKGKGGGSIEEASAKRIRQAVYDIRYRARREEIDLKAAYSQYMSNSNLSQQERAAVREKLFGKEGGGVKEQFSTGADDWAIDNVSKALYKVFSESEEGTEIELAYLQQLDEDEDKKYKVRVTDTSGKSYVRYANRTKITQLRQNSNIKSVEMTEHGTPYEGERKRGTQTAKAKGGLDPVGKEDADIDNDGDHDKNDKYLLKRRKAIGSAIKKRAGQKLKEDMVVETAKAKVDNYKKGENGKTAVTVSPVNSEPTPEVQAASKRGIYSHLELTGTELSESQKRFLEFVAEKKACSKKKKKAYSEATVNTPDCEKKEEEKEKDMRGTYTAINLVKNKLRSQGCKNPIVMLSDVDDEKEKVKEDAEYGYDKKGNSLNPKDKVDGSKERTAADPDMPRRMGKQKNMKPGQRITAGDMRPAPSKTGGPKTKKPTPSKGDRGPATGKRYNPFKDGRTPTSASQTTGP